MVLEANRYSLWVKTVEGQPVEILLPFDPRLGDFAERMAELLGDLQRDEQRSQLEILRDIEVGSCDIFRFRKEPHSGFLGAIPIEDGVRFVGYARDFLLYGATAEYEPTRLTVGGRRSEDVARFMSKALLGQTEVSSFVVTAQIPIPARLTDDLFPEAVEASSEPFERRAGIRLMNVLSYTREAALEAAQTNNFGPFSEIVREGATVNLYSALVEAQEIVPGEPLEISCSWAPIRPLIGRAPVSSVRFEPEIVQPLKAAVEILKPRIPKEGERVFGYVELLQQEAQEVLIGDLAITTVMNKREIKVHLSLQRPDYDQAIVAFREKRPIEITGDLVKEGRYWVLRNPRDLVVHTAPSNQGTT
ncbi:MAG TPA: hypothetical protein VGM86_26785 [Thermoanaerobaculia bacterium]|jgi:hypothetical protein